MTKNLAILDSSLPISNLDAYIARAHAMPMLTEAEEKDLTQKFYENNDLEAARRLVTAHLRFVISTAKGYLGYGLPLGDLIQEGNVGLMKAVKRFDPSVGVRLVTFAVYWIKAEIHDYILKNWRIVKVATTKAQRKLFFKLRGAKDRLKWFSHDEAQSVAKDLDVKPETVLQMEGRLTARDAAFDGYAADDTAENRTAFAPSEYLGDASANPANILENDDWQEQHHQAMYAAIQTLDNRSKEILSARWLSNKKATLQDLAAKYNVSAERIRQIEKLAMDKMKRFIEKNVAH